MVAELVCPSTAVRCRADPRSLRRYTCPVPGEPDHCTRTLGSDTTRRRQEKKHWSKKQRKWKDFAISLTKMLRKIDGLFCNVFCNLFVNKALGYGSYIKNEKKCQVNTEYLICYCTISNVGEKY